MSVLMERWRAFSDRERLLIGTMLAIAAVMLLWLGVWRPVEAAIADRWVRHSLAVERGAAVRAKVAALKALPRTPGVAAASAAQAVSAAALAAGLTLDRADQQGQGRVSVSIGQVRAGALLAFLSELERQGLLVETASISSGPVADTVAAQISLKAGSQ